MELHQKTLLEKRSFFLLSNKLKLYWRNIEGEQENYIRYETLKGEAKIRCRREPKLLFISLIAMTFSGCLLLQSLSIGRDFYDILLPLGIAVFFGCLFVCLYLYKRENYIILETCDRQKVVFFRNKPNRRDLERFLTYLWSYRKQYLREKYFYIDHNHDLKQQTERLRWLLEQRAITKAEYKFAQEDWIIDRSFEPRR